ncbi:hypothetical protein HUX88_25905 [Duganella sp. BJB1802]|uniref:hypothetical protein n=1 Tax=Duganella sp. BJB1802 TaxID=2744575 RepID=UPI001593B4B3|nr:hypothetical protein [Duganella sp. BJB1802]NVD73937.1 hypothetical protein [Duganella sp. BJB1802]
MAHPARVEARQLVELGFEGEQMHAEARRIDAVGQIDHLVFRTRPEQTGQYHHKLRRHFLVPECASASHRGAAGGVPAARDKATLYSI